MPKWITNIPKTTWLKAVISFGAIGAIVLRILYPELKLDAIALGLLVVAVLPWFTSLIESAKFPGGWEVKFRDLKDAAEQITGDSDAAAAEATEGAPDPSYIAIAQSDPNLALAGLRIEIERRVRQRAERHNVREHFSLRRMLNELQRRGVFDFRAIGGLNEIIMAGNRAAHGAPVEPSVSQWAIQYGPIVIAVLDQHLRDTDAS